ncbi:hypothetical protein C8Q70DRAFT_653810 [Cubamyces menziesii]|nr:hypothetical protein C8Q70DRAFT_653810 [Cubamyces menziesii]
MTSKPFWPVTGGNYVLLNAEGKNALTLVDIDGEPTLDCRELRLELNQQWTFIDTGHGSAIQSCQRSKDDRRFYLAISGGLEQHKTQIVPSPTPLSFYISVVDGGITIAWPESKYVVELGERRYGPNAGKIRLGKLANGPQPHPSALWHFSCCGGPGLSAPSTEARRTEGRPEAAPANDSTTALHVLTDTSGKMALQLDRISGKLIKLRNISQDWAQQWRFVPSGAGYTIETRLAASLPAQAGDDSGDRPLYLTVDGPAQPGATVVATRFPTSWRVERNGTNKDALRVFWPGTNLLVSWPGPRILAQHASERYDRIILAECDREDGPLTTWTDVVVLDSESS